MLLNKFQNKMRQSASFLQLHTEVQTSLKTGCIVWVKSVNLKELIKFIIHGNHRIVVSKVETDAGKTAFIVEGIDFVFGQFH